MCLKHLDIQAEGLALLAIHTHGQLEIKSLLAVKDVIYVDLCRTYYKYLLARMHKTYYAW